MLSLAALWAPAQNGSAGFLASFLAGDGAPAAPQGGDLPAGCAARDAGHSVASGAPCPHAAYSTHATYWPCELLNAFIVKMAATGHCVSAAMMLGDRFYAQEQLATARGTGQQGLVDLAQRLQAYFDAAALDGCTVAAALDEAETGRLLLV